MKGTLSGGSSITQTRAKSYSDNSENGKDKELSKGQECSEDDDATLPKAWKPTRSLSPKINSVNHPTRREDNPASLSLSGPQITDLVYERVKLGSTFLSVIRSLRRQRRQRFVT